MLRTLFLSAFFCVSVTGHAQTFTLESAVSHALKNNPELAAARFSIEEAQGRLLQSGRRSNPELESDLKPSVRGREFTFGVGFVQKFPLTNRLRLEKAVSQAELAAAESEIRAAEWRLAAAVRTVGGKYLSLQQSRALKERLIANSRELANSAADLAKRAEGSEAEAAQFELEAQQIELELLQIESEKAVLAGELRPLLGISSAETVGIKGELPGISLPEGAAVDVSQRADYQTAQAKAEAARQGIDLARANRWEDLSVGLSAEVGRAEDAPEGLETEGFIGLRFSLPLPLWNKNEGRIKEAEAAAARTRKEVDAVALQVRAEAAAALGEMKAAARIVDETGNALLPKAQSIEDKLAKFYKEAQPGTQLSDVLRAREKRLALEQAKLDALRTYHLARIRFAAATGR